MTLFEATFEVLLPLDLLDAYLFQVCCLSRPCIMCDEKAKITSKEYFGGLEDW